MYFNNRFSLVQLLKQNRYISQNIITEIGDEISLEAIIKVVCHWYNITELGFYSKVRYREIVISRQVYCYFARIMTNKTYVEIGDPVSYDHSNVIYSINNVKKLIENSQSLPDIEKIPEIYMDIEHRFKHKIIRQNII